MRRVPPEVLLPAFLTVIITAARGADTLEIVPGIDLPLTVATGAVGGGIAYIRAERYVPDDFEGKTSLINPIDRPFAGLYRPRAAGISDYTLAATILTSPIFLAFTHNRPNHVFEELLLVSESIALTNIQLQLTKTAVSRPRPLMYSDDLPEKQRFRADNYLSFYSGHAAMAFSFATSTTLLVMNSDVDNLLKAVTAATTFSLATVTATLRVVSGKHFPTDVLSGATIGVATSMIVMEAHKSESHHHDDLPRGSVAVFSLRLTVQ